MKKSFSILLLALCAMLICGGCSTQTPPANDATPDAAAREDITEWPVNTYTDAIIKPEVGTPAYVITDETAGYYAIFVQGITMEQGQQYIDTLKTNGFAEVAGESNEVVVGQLLQKDSTKVSISVSADTLGIYIMLK